MADIPEEIRYRKMIDNIARTLEVNKNNKWDASCVRDEQSGAVICASKTFVNDNTHKVSGYVKIGGSLVFTKGSSEDIKKLMESIGP